MVKSIEEPVYIIPRIKNKKDSYRIWEQGGFGNRLQAWFSLEELREASYSGQVGIRYSDVRGGGSLFVPFLDQNTLTAKVKELEEKGYRRADMVFSEMAPDYALTINGEVNDFWDLWYSHVKKPMRIALKEWSRHESGVRARMIMRQFMNDASYADLCALMDLYPAHTIEFSCYPFHLGNIPGRNSVIWEVRKY